MSISVGTFRAWSEIDGSRLGWLALLPAGHCEVAQIHRARRQMEADHHAQLDERNVAIWTGVSPAEAQPLLRAIKLQHVEAPGFLIVLTRAHAMIHAPIFCT
jgi:hypothetical protein